MPHEQTGSPADIVARLDRIPAGAWHVRARMILGIGTFFDGFDLLAISFALPVLAEAWAMTPQQSGLVLSAAFVGQLLGALLCGWAAERFGRLRVANTTIAIFSVMSLACAFTTGPVGLIVCRFIQGIGLGGEVPVATTYVTEFAPAKGRGRFYILYELVFVFGLIGAALLGAIMVPRLGWQSMFFVGAFPAILTLFLRRLLPESPRWLASQGRLAEADAATSLLEASARAAGTTLPPPRPDLLTAPPAKGDWREMFGPVLRGRTFAVWALWFCCFSTSYGLQGWMPTLYRTVFHLPLQQSLSYGLITQLVGVCGSFTAAMLIDRIGRRGWFRIGLLAGGLILISVWPLGVRSAAQLLAVVSIGGFFISSVAIGLNLYTPELYPTRIRAVASSVGGAWQRVAAAIGPLVVGSLVAGNNLGLAFAYFGALAILGAGVAHLFAIETARRSLEDIAR